MAEYRRQEIAQLGGDSGFRSYRRVTELTSPKVCKSFIIGSCPHDLFVGTKQDLGKCPQLHLEKHKLEYNLRTKKGEKFPDFEYEYYQVLKSYIEEIDRIIESSNKRLDHTPEDKEKIEQVTQDLEKLDTKISIIQQEINCLLEAGKPIASLNHSKELNTLIKLREVEGEKVRSIIENIGQSSQQKLQACDQCGAFLSRLDSDRRLADHFVGKIHLGYVKMRSDYMGLKEKYEGGV
ncbi:protein Luc7p [[Candida] jaroonii]|uniref:Protein Luc7p n=1 Tax=[Candida] jaroonii TaxID=467808 RepID=A0ACA9Y7H9_9ASCO|nr:protein Luc7p [[Candida] jaroonii]